MSAHSTWALALACTVAVFLCPRASHAQATFTTNFNAEPPGFQADPAGNMSFLLPGAVRDLANAAYTVPASNRFWGFFGSGVGQIRIGSLADQTTQAADVTLTLRGTQSGDIANIGFLDDADLSLVWFDQNDIDYTIDVPAFIPNNGFLTFTIDAANLSPTSSISRLAIINSSSSNASYAVLGEIGYTEWTAPVPEPSPALLGFLACSILALTRRR